jgi:hypothetical protein
MHFPSIPFSSPARNPHLSSAQTNRVPHPSRTCDGWDVNRPPATSSCPAFAVALALAVALAFAIVLALAVVSSCRHSERSEESRGSRPAIAVRSFPPRISTVVAASPTPKQNPVISTEDTHGLTVSITAEKSASLPHLPRPQAVAVVLVVALGSSADAEPISRGRRSN